jgi:hypothetical protein
VSKLIARFAVVVATVVTLGCGRMNAPVAAAPTFNTPFQAVLLDTGQVYFGKIEGLGTDYPILRDVYYIQTGTNADTKQATNVLIRRGKEFHGPEFTVLNARHIAMIEPVSPTSKVAELIAEQEKPPQK